MGIEGQSVAQQPRGRTYSGLPFQPWLTDGGSRCGGPPGCTTRSGRRQDAVECRGGVEGGGSLYVAMEP